MAKNLNLSFVISVPIMLLMFQQLIVESRNLNSEPVGHEINKSQRTFGRDFGKLHKRVKLPHSASKFFL